MKPIVESVQLSRAEEQADAYRHSRRHEKDSWDVRVDHPPPPLRVHRVCPGCGRPPGGVGDAPSYCRSCGLSVVRFGTVDRERDYQIEIPPQHPAAGASVRPHSAAQTTPERDGARAAAAVPPGEREVRR